MSEPPRTRVFPSDKFLVAFSFAGEQRELVHSIAKVVEQRLGLGTVFYDAWFEDHLAGFAADAKLQEIYLHKSELVIMGVSDQYGSKKWTLVECDAVRARGMQLRTSKNPQDVYRILPLRVGDGDVPGILFNTIVPDIRTRTPEATADLIINRLRLACPPAKAEITTTVAERRVFLAECTPDLEVETQPVSRQRMKGILEAAGWIVLPREEYPAAEYQARLESDLRTCLAFVQLLGPYPWKRGGFDRIQNDAAKHAGIARYRFRSSEIDLAKIEPVQREFLSDDGVIATGFDDFLHHLTGKLAALAVPRAKASSPANPPLIRIGIRSENPDQRWAQVFEWMFAEQEEILFDQLGPGETFLSKHAGEPCHGFLIACDSAAFAEGQNSPRDMLEQCRRLQITEKDAARRPPVAIVYWPPPDPHESWSRLLRVRPLNLHRLSAGDAPKAPKDLDAFFNEVRKVAL